MAVESSQMTCKMNSSDKVVKDVGWVIRELISALFKHIDGSSNIKYNQLLVIQMPINSTKLG